MSGETATQSQPCYGKAARDFLEAQEVSRANEQRIENVFVEVIEKNREYRDRNKRLAEENHLVKRAMRKFYKISVDERNKNQRMQVEMEAMKKSHDAMQRKLASVQQKYQQLHQQMSAVLREIDANDVIANSQTE